VATVLGCGEALRPEPTSVVLITIDTLRVDRLGCYGYFRDTSPTLDAFSEEAVLFEHAFTPMATTLPAHVSLLTGTNPSRHGVVANVQHFGRRIEQANGAETLATMLHRAGYQTAAFVSARPIGSHTGIEADFDSFVEPPGKEWPAEETTHRVLAFLESPPPTPLLLWVHYFDPHDPYAAPAPYRGQYRMDAAMEHYLESNHFPDTPVESIPEANNRYDEEVRYVDDQIAQLLERLREIGLYDSAVTVIVGDHGEGLGQHNGIRHGRIYNEQIRIPLMIRFPVRLSIPPGRRDPLASIIDILPTLDAAVGLPLSESDREQFEGINLFNPKAERDYVWSERVLRKGRWEPGRKFALTGRRWKYFHLTEGPDQLYDLAADPWELRNVIARHPEVAEELREKLMGQLQAYLEQASALAVDKEIPPHVLEQLRSLGYVD
jgi:arylsulfatase A-like enzyme